MATTPTSAPDAAKASDTDLDQVLREAVLTMESTDYQDGNPAFNTVTPRDWLIMIAVYVAIPVLFALVVGLP